MTALHLLSRLKLWRCARVGARVQVLGNVYVFGGGHIEVGDDVVLDGRLVPVELHAEPGAVLIVGHGCVLEGGVSVEAQERVELGPGCHLRAFSKVMDNHFHPVSGARHVRPPSRPVKLEAAVEVGQRAIVLPGAWLEAQVKVGPGVVVARRVRRGQTFGDRRKSPRPFTPSEVEGRERSPDPFTPSEVEGPPGKRFAKGPSTPLGTNGVGADPASGGTS